MHLDRSPLVLVHLPFVQLGRPPFSLAPRFPFLSRRQAPTYTARLSIREMQKKLPNIYRMLDKPRPAVSLAPTHTPRSVCSVAPPPLRAAEKPDCGGNSEGKASGIAPRISATRVSASVVFLGSYICSPAFLADGVRFGPSDFLQGPGEGSGGSAGERESIRGGATLVRDYRSHTVGEDSLRVTLGIRLNNTYSLAFRRWPLISRLGLARPVGHQVCLIRTNA